MIEDRAHRRVSGSVLRKFLLVNTFVALLLILSFDVAVFYSFPARYTRQFPDYRYSSPPDVGGRGWYPSGYFVNHEKRGFDIGRNKTGRHWVDGVTYPIWSNSLGCFDDEHPQYSRYVYFAGDSWTWGYTPFGQKFGTIIERRTGTPILKCGVTHTGQQHQFEKLIDLVKEIGKPPRAIFVFYSANDVANDYAHPHSTVIDSWLIDNVSLDSNNELVRHSDHELKRKMQDRLRRFQEYKHPQVGWWTRAKANLKYYSLTINILIHLRDRVFATPQKVVAIPQKAGLFKNLYFLPQDNNGMYWLSNNPKAKKNSASLLDLANFSRNISAEFVVVLIPDKENVTDTKWYQEVRQFLTNNGIRHLDLTLKFREKGYTSGDLYWTNDGHFSPSGNRIVAEILMQEFPNIFRQNDSETHQKTLRSQ